MPQQTITNGKPDDTFTQNVDDSVYQIPRGDLHRNKREAVRALVLVETNGGRYAYGVDPVQAGLGYPTSDGDMIELKGFDEIYYFKIINDTAASAIDLTITIFYK